MEKNGTYDEHFISLIKGGTVKKLSRIAVRAERESNGFLLQGLRDLVTTYQVESLLELRRAIQASKETEISAFDIRRLGLDDTRLFAGALGSKCESSALVYVVTQEQFEIFDPTAFGFVY